MGHGDYLHNMDEFTPEALVNRDEPVSIQSMKPRRRSKGSPDSAHSRSSSGSKNSLQDRLFTKYVFAHNTFPVWVANTP